MAWRCGTAILQGGVARSIAAVAVAGIVTLAAPPPAAARVIVSVELVYGSVAVGGLGIFVALAGSWEAFAAQGGIPDALIEVQGGRTRFGMFAEEILLGLLSLLLASLKKRSPGGG